MSDSIVGRDVCFREAHGGPSAHSGSVVAAEVVTIGECAQFMLLIKCVRRDHFVLKSAYDTDVWFFEEEVKGGE